MSKSKASLAEEARERQEAREKLWTLIRSNRPDAVYTVFKHRNRAGDRRVLQVLVPVTGYEAGQICIRDVSIWVAQALGLRWSNTHDGVVVHGGGMDMGWELVYRLSSAITPAGQPVAALAHRWL